MKALDRSLSKYAFNTKVRGVYVAESDHFDGSKIGYLAGLLKPFDDLNRNQFIPMFDTSVDIPWIQDRGKKNTTKWKKQEINDYKKRAYTPLGDGDSGMVLTTEELATLFHLPGKVASTPTLGRIPSTRSEAPANLPVGFPSE